MEVIDGAFPVKSRYKKPSEYHIYILVDLIITSVLMHALFEAKASCFRGCSLHCICLLATMERDGYCINKEISHFEGLRESATAIR